MSLQKAPKPDWRKLKRNRLKQDNFTNVIKRVEKAKGKTLLQHAIERAYEDDTVLKAILSKIVPDKSKSIEDKVVDHKPMKIVRSESANISKPE